MHAALCPGAIRGEGLTTARKGLGPWALQPLCTSFPAATRLPRVLTNIFRRLGKGRDACMQLAGWLKKGLLIERNVLRTRKQGLRIWTVPISYLCFKIEIKITGTCIWFLVQWTFRGKNESRLKEVIFGITYFHLVIPIFTFGNSYFLCGNYFLFDNFCSNKSWHR